MIVMAAVIGLAILYSVYLYIRILRPLKKMRDFTAKISDDNIERSTDTDTSRAFGMFSDSFNTVYDELQRSREREIALKKNEMEVYASLNRELKKPVTGIKLTAELLRTKLLAENDKEENGYIIEKMENIYNRAEQMEDILNSLLSTALDGFGEFMVNCAATESRLLEDMVKKADYRQVVSMTSIPYVLIHIDENRMRQVVKNIIENSYKYANSTIDVSFLLTDDFLQMKIADHGPGVAADEIGLVTNRFYRGRRWADSSEEGSGLGLFIAKTLMQKMDGSLVVDNTEDGFCVTLLIKLS